MFQLIQIFIGDLFDTPFDSRIFLTIVQNPPDINIQCHMTFLHTFVLTVSIKYFIDIHFNVTYSILFYSNCRTYSIFLFKVTFSIYPLKLEASLKYVY